MSGATPGQSSVLLQRLLGAAVLFGGLFLLSLLLPQAPESDEAPNLDDGRTRHVRIDLHPVAPPAVPAGDVSAPETDVPGVEAPAAASADAHIEANAEDEPAVAAQAPPAEPVPAPKPAPEPKTKPKPASKPAPAEAAQAPVAAGWWVQVASFGKQSNAQGLVERLRARDLPARAEQVDISGRKLYRVLVGPYSERAKADSARGQIILIGFSDSRTVQR